MLNRNPTMLIRKLNEQEMAVRFWNIGGRSTFITLLQRFRSEFLLARAQKIEGLDWLALLETQRPDVVDFCRRYGLQSLEER